MVSPAVEAVMADWMVAYCEGTYRVAACVTVASSIRTPALARVKRDLHMRYMGCSFGNRCCLRRDARSGTCPIQAPALYLHNLIRFYVDFGSGCQRQPI